MEGIHVLDVAEDDLLFPLQCTGEDLRDKPRATFLETRERENGGEDSHYRCYTSTVEVRCS